MKKTIMNYINKRGVRSSIAFGPNETKAIKTLIKCMGMDSIQDYVDLAVKTGEKGIGVTRLLRDRMFEDLLTMIPYKKEK